MTRLRFWLIGLSVIALSMQAAAALAEPVKIVVPFAAGGPVDQLARILASGLGPQLGADVIVDDRGGAGGAIAAEYVARATPDGDTTAADARLRRDRSDAEAAGRLQSEGVRAGHAGRLGAITDYRPQRTRRRDAPGAGCQGKAAKAHLRLCRSGHDHADRDRDAQRRRGREDHPRALSRRSACDCRSAGRPYRHAQRRSAGAAAAGESRTGQGAGAVFGRAFAAFLPIYRPPPSLVTPAWWSRTGTPWCCRPAPRCRCATNSNRRCRRSWRCRRSNNAWPRTACTACWAMRRLRRCWSKEFSRWPSVIKKLGITGE